MPIISPSGGGGGGGGSGLLLAATKHLATADLLTLATVPVVVVPAAGVGKIIVPIHGFFQLHAGATPFDSFGTGNLDLNAAGTELIVGGFANSNYGVDFAGTPLTSATSVAWASKDHGSDVFAIDPALLANQALTLIAESANPTQGNGNADLTVWYCIYTQT